MWPSQLTSSTLAVNHTTIFPARPASAALFAFSYCWPHVQLFLMHVFFYIPPPIPFPSHSNYWLAFWGKWSLADAFVVCCVIGLFNLTLDMDFFLKSGATLSTMSTAFANPTARNTKT